MAIHHEVTIPSANNTPHPSGTPQDIEQPNPTPTNLWTCDYACTISGHSDTVVLLWDGEYFSLPDSEANDNNFGSVSFTYDPPLS